MFVSMRRGKTALSRLPLRVVYKKICHIFLNPHHQPPCSTQPLVTPDWSRNVFPISHSRSLSLSLSESLTCSLSLSICCCGIWEDFKHREEETARLSGRERDVAKGRVHKDRRKRQRRREGEKAIQHRWREREGRGRGRESNGWRGLLLPFIWPPWGVRPGERCLSPIFLPVRLINDHHNVRTHMLARHTPNPGVNWQSEDFNRPSTPHLCFLMQAYMGNTVHKNKTGNETIQKAID